MNPVVQSLKFEIAEVLRSNFKEVEASKIQIQPTRKEFEGEYTMVAFALTKDLGMNPFQIGQELGAALVENGGMVKDFQVVKGFLNLTMKAQVFSDQLATITEDDYDFRINQGNNMVAVVEYSSPNTNKPLHLGHLRNNFLGYSVSQILDANGFDTKKVQIINDRGIHICKSMLAWKKFGEGETPESSGLKGDQLVGKYYVRFEKEFRKEVAALAVKESLEEKEAEAKSSLMKEAKEMLVNWEHGDSETVALWEKMNGWVYEGFDVTYTKMGVSFDKLYYESQTYLKGRDIVMDGLEKGLFFKKDDGSVWVDLEDEGLDQKLLIRSDGTSVYMTQDIGTAVLRYEDFPELDRAIYTVGNEQDYHFKVLFLILKKLGYDWADRCFHLSYGMVDLPSGKMKSREGTVVDADDLISEMKITAEAQTKELGKIDDLNSKEAEQLFEMVGLGALKFFLLRTDPKKRMLFDPQESIQFQGNTGPFIQYTHARIRSLIRRAKADGIDFGDENIKKYQDLKPIEREILVLLLGFKEKLQESSNHYDPSLIAHYCFDISKEFNRFYAELSIFGDKDPSAAPFRLGLSLAVAKTIQFGMSLLGIGVPEKM